MGDLEIPNFGALLAPAISSVSEAARPGLLARLERGAADRYRMWVEAEPTAAEVLKACAAREDEIADVVDGLFPLSDADLPIVEKAVPLARELYYEAFAGKSVLDQWRIQANAERQGAMAWRGIASQTEDESTCRELERCSALEEQSADALDGLIAERAG
jgi:hypothetical protein